MKRVLKFVGIALCAGLALLVVVPLVIPIPPLAGTTSPERLADADSQFIALNGVTVHYKKAGGGPRAFVLLHGFGASVFSWERVRSSFAALGTTLAYDRPAFGLTSRPLPGEWHGENPYSPAANVELLREFLDAQDIQSAVLVGNSAGGTVAADFALHYPERVQGLVLVDAAIYEGGRPAWLSPLLALPQIQRLGPWLVRGIADRGDDIIRLAWHDPDKIPPETFAGYRKPLQAKDWDIALWQFTQAAGPRDLPARLEELKMPVLVITGDDDRIVPTANSIRLARELPNAKLVVIPNCGHVPHEECPDVFMRAVQEFVSANAKGLTGAKWASKTSTLP